MNIRLIIINKLIAIIAFLLKAQTISPNKNALTSSKTINRICHLF